MLKVVKLLAAVPGIALAELPVGVIAWDADGNFYEEWAPDERNAFWQEIIEKAKQHQVLTPRIVEYFDEHLVNGQTMGMEVDEVEIPESSTAAEVFSEQAAELHSQWASVSTQVEDAIDRAVEQQGNN